MTASVPPGSSSSSRERALSIAIIVVAAIWIGIAGVRWGTWSAGSADAHGYISQAQLWRQGNLIVAAPMALTVPWEDAEWIFAPLGYRPGVAPGTLVPVYPAGLPIVMAGLQAVGGPQAVYFAVPIFGIMAVLASARLATRLATPAAGAVAAVCMASSPTFLFSLMWPMTDVPAAALWVLGVVLATGTGIASAVGAGLAIALAVLTRPNLVLVALAPAAYLLWRIKATPNERSSAWARLVIVCVLAAAGCLAVAAIHTWLYGSPLSTGYGHASQIYDVSRIATTASGFVVRPLALEPPLVILCAAGLAWGLSRPGVSRSIAWLAAGTLGLVFVSYAFYVSFPEWWYLRLLLPAWPAAAAFAGLAAVGIARLAPAAWRAAVLILLGVLIVGVGARETVHRGVFTLREAESRYETVGRFASGVLPPNAVFFSFQQSGALRHYADRPIIRFDVLPPHWFDDALSKMRFRGYRPYFIIEEHEEVVFKARFRPVSPLGYLDWQPMAQLDGPVRVQIFDPADRDKMRRNEPYPTVRLTP